MTLFFQCHDFRQVTGIKAAITLDANMILTAFIFVLFYGQNHIPCLPFSVACNYLKL